MLRGGRELRGSEGREVLLQFLGRKTDGFVGVFLKGALIRPMRRMFCRACMEFAYEGLQQAEERLSCFGM